MEFLKLALRQVNPPARRVSLHVAQNIGQLKRLAEVNGIITARRIPVAENFNAQQPHDGGDPVAIKFQRLPTGVAPDVQIHFTAFDQFIQQREGQLELLDDRLEFLVEDKLRFLIFAGAADVRAPGGELGAADFRGHGIFVGHVIHGAAEAVKRGHGVAFFARQEHEGEREVGGALFGERAAVLHGHVPCGGSSGPRNGGRPPVWASVGLIGRCFRRRLDLR